MIAFEHRLASNTRRVLRFILITVIAFAPVAFFVTADFPTTWSSPMGLVLKDNGLDDVKNDEWVINIGGYSNDGYAAGIQIPIYVLIFGIAGGYLKYLYDTYKDWQNWKDTGNRYGSDPNAEYPINPESLEHEERRNFPYRTMKDLVLLVLSPLLAVGSYFILLQVGIKSDQLPTILIVSFTAGLLTDSIIEKMVSFGEGLLPKTNISQNSKSKNNNILYVSGDISESSGTLQFIRHVHSNISCPTSAIEKISLLKNDKVPIHSCGIDAIWKLT